MIEWIKKHSYWALAGGVVLVAILALLAYILNFWGRPPSSDPGDWANFATYVSGTVGVAAVVATLVAFVITLNQQQVLIKSQDQMLETQKKQIETTERLSQKDHVYKGSLEIFPVLVDILENSLKESTQVYVKGVRNYSPDTASIIRVGSLHQYFIIGSFEDEIVASIKNPFCHEVKEYGPLQFQTVHAIAEFINEALSVDEKLIYVFDYYLSKDLGFGKNGWFYIECYKEFLIGRDARDKFSAIIRKESKSPFDGLLEKNTITLRWGAIGRYVIDDSWVYTGNSLK